MKWIAKINEYDNAYGEEILLGVDGGELGFEVVLSNDEESGVMPGMTYDEAVENLEDYFGYYDTFQWISEDE